MDGGATARALQAGSSTGCGSGGIAGWMPQSWTCPLWFPDVSVVLEGQAKAALAGQDGEISGIRVVLAPGEGDDEIVAETQRRIGSSEQVIVVTSDRGLADRVSSVGARVVGAGWLLSQLDQRA